MSGGNRKHGRSKNRPSNKRYTAEQRWISNKALSIKRESLRVARAALKKIMRLPAISRDNEKLYTLRKQIDRLAA